MTTLDRPVDDRHQPAGRPAEDVRTLAWRRLGRAWGPGPMTGRSDDEPPRIAADAQPGAQFKAATLWTVIVRLPLMRAVQQPCDRTAQANAPQPDRRQPALMALDNVSQITRGRRDAGAPAPFTS